MHRLGRWLDQWLFHSSKSFQRNHSIQGWQQVRCFHKTLHASSKYIIIPTEARRECRPHDLQHNSFPFICFFSPRLLFFPYFLLCFKQIFPLLHFMYFCHFLPSSPLSLPVFLVSPAPNFPCLLTSAIKMETVVLKKNPNNQINSASKIETGKLEAADVLGVQYRIK